MRIIFIILTTIFATGITHADGYVKIGDWKVKSGDWCWIKSSGWKNSIEAVYSKDLGLLGRIIKLDIYGTALLGGQSGWNKCHFFYVGKKEFGFIRERDGHKHLLTLADRDEKFDRIELTQNRMLEFLSALSAIPQLSCIEIDLEDKDHTWYTAAKFSSNGAVIALKEFETCISRAR